MADLFDPPGRRGAPAVIPRRQMVDAILFIGRTGCQWRYLPQLGRWRRLSRCYEGTEASARAWLEVASVGYLAWRAVA